MNDTSNTQGQESILLVEDEPLLREMVRDVLQCHGYAVVEASDGVEALEIWDRDLGQFDILVTDIVLPNDVSGPEVARKLRRTKPDLRVVYTSGYDSEAAGQDLSAEQGFAFLQKPYKHDALLEKIRSLGEGASAAKLT